MRPRIVGYGSGGRAPPNTARACFEAFDSGADAVAVDVCETLDAVVVVGNRRTLRLLKPRAVPSWAEIEDADLGEVFGARRSNHRVQCLGAFLDAMGPLSVQLVVDGPMSSAAWKSFERAVRDRRQGETTVLAPPGSLNDLELPPHVRRVAVLREGEDASEIPPRGINAVAASARSLSMVGLLRLPKVALACDTRSALTAAKAAGVTAVHTERPAWLRCAWDASVPALH